MYFCPTRYCLIDIERECNNFPGLFIHAHNWENKASSLPMRPKPELLVFVLTAMLQNYMYYQ